MNLEPIPLGAVLLCFLLCGRKNEATSLIWVFSLCGVKPLCILRYGGCLGWAVPLHSKFHITSCKHTLIYLQSVLILPGTHSGEAEPHPEWGTLLPGLCQGQATENLDRISKVYPVQVSILNINLRLLNTRLGENSRTVKPSL